MEPREYCRIFERYAKNYMAGAFATPMAGDVETAIKEDRLHHLIRDEFLAFETKSNKVLRRKDFTGATYTIPAGASVISHVARLGNKVPKLKKFDVVYAYQEDKVLVEALKEQGFALGAVTISAASEIKGVYVRGLIPALEYEPHDVATLGRIKWKISEKLQKAIVKEVEKIQGWRDDYPYYNKDGSWAQVCLRGYNPDDPFWGVKPAEMSKRWKEEHPEEATWNECDWTVLTKKTPALMELIQSVEWWGEFERIRLLQMYKQDGAKDGVLLRHTDITDRDAGTADGQICRFHAPILSHPDARTHAWDMYGNEIVKNLKPWRLYYLDQRKPHMVTVPAGVNRIHLVPDVIADDKVRERIA